MNAPAIAVRGIEKSYKDLHVLRGVDFEVEKGSIFALLGSNGAGKTTIVRILSTLLTSDAVVRPEALLGSGFEFEHPTPADAIRASLG